MRRKTVWLGLLTAAIVVLSSGLATAAPTTGEQVLSASELGSTFGACCRDDFVDSQTCSKTNGWPCFTCITAPALCGIAREYSGNPIQQCIDGVGGICIFVQEVDCYRNITCNQSEPIFWDCKVSGGACDIDLTTACVECTPGAAGPWIPVDSFICDE